MNLVKIFNQLQETNSLLEKEKILLENQSNQDFKDLLYFVFNPLAVTGISDKKINKNVSKTNNTYSLKSWREITEYLSVHNTGSDNDIASVQSFLDITPAEEQEFWKQVFTKNLRLGCNAKTINKAYGKNFIPNFGCMLAEKYLENPKVVEGKDFTITTKMDGNRAIFIIKNGIINVFSRQGLTYEGLTEINNELIDSRVENIVIDGELLVSNFENLPSDKCYKETSKIVRKNGEKVGLTLVVFDIINLNQFEQGISYEIYARRREQLENLFGSGKYKHITPVKKHYSGNDISKIQYYLNELTNDGQEGIMINLNDAPYECKRTKNILKFKKFETADVKCINLTEGEGNFKNMLGAITVEFEHNGCFYLSDCGSGFTQQEREDYWQNPEKILNKIVEIDYFEISKNDKGSFGLRFPTWKHRIRDDKTEISMY